MINIDDYKRACKIAAKIVATFGDKYLPFFERAHNELRNAEAQLELKTTALMIALSE